MGRRIPILLSVLLAGVMAGGAVGVIVGATSTPTIKACVQTGGLMRYLASGSCRTGEKLVTWNVQGVAGPKGATGATGPQGPAGSGGGSAAMRFYLADPHQTTEVAPNTPFTTSSLRVAANSYLINATGFMYLAEGAALITCELRTNETPGTGTPIDTERLVVAGFEYYALQGYRTFTAPTSLYVVCTATLTSGNRSSALALFQMTATVAERLTPAP